MRLSSLFRCFVRSAVRLGTQTLAIDHCTLFLAQSGLSAALSDAFGSLLFPLLETHFIFGAILGHL